MEVILLVLPARGVEEAVVGTEAVEAERGTKGGMRDIMTQALMRIHGRSSRWLMG
jgi:hypothetical protein